MHEPLADLRDQDLEVGPQVPVSFVDLDQFGVNRVIGRVCPQATCPVAFGAARTFLQGALQFDPQSHLQPSLVPRLHFVEAQCPGARPTDIDYEPVMRTLSLQHCDLPDTEAFLSFLTV